MLADGAVQELRAIVNLYSPDLIMCDYKIFRSERARKKNPNEDHIPTFSGRAGILLDDPVVLFEGLYKKGKLHSWSKISKRKYWNELRFPEGKYFEDMVVTPRLALKISTFFYQPKVWILYRKRSGSILSIPSYKKVTDMIRGTDGVLRLWIENVPRFPSTARFIFIQYCVKVWFFSRKELRKINSLNKAELLRLREHFYMNIELTKWELFKHYCYRGRFIMAAKLLTSL